VRPRDPVELFDRIATMTRCLRTAAADTYAAFGVPSGHAKFLRHIGRSAPVSQAELARATRTDPALTGRMLESMIERGWVKRTRSEEDRRQYVLELSVAGLRAKKRVDEARAELAAQVARVLDERDAEDFDRIATKILEAFESPKAD
jgi:DNA-binding MarR family transcriptional regulator